MNKTYKQFDSREKFLESLGHWHYDKKLCADNEFKVITRIHTDYSEELFELKQQLEIVKTTWNDQSIKTIRRKVAQTTNAAINLDIMSGQEQDKLRAGYHMDKAMYHVKKVDAGSIWERIGHQFGLENPLVRLHVQFPGDITVWHTDIFSPQHDLLPGEISVTEETVGQDMGFRRIIIALEDWDWGQCFMFGAKTWSQWQAGDTIYWKFGTPHCAANMGLSPRICMSVTGKLTAQFEKLINV